MNRSMLAPVDQHIAVWINDPALVPFATKPVRHGVDLHHQVRHTCLLRHGAPLSHRVFLTSCLSVMPIRSVWAILGSELASDGLDRPMWRFQRVSYDLATQY
jgi:hypothetical protein